ncbi:MAG: hypothetical protein ABFS28_12270 [Bacteroidota bacterium]
MNRWMKLFLIAVMTISSTLRGEALNTPASSGDVSGEWQLGFHREREALPEEWFPASVPGAVQLDYARAHGWGDHMYAENWKDYGWMEDVYWTYRTRFPAPRMEEGDRFFFISKGIDYKYEIYLNGVQLLTREGMFRAVELDLTDHLTEANELKILIHPVPKIPGKPEDRSQAAQSVKPAVSYGWDWHPRLIPSGIWDETWFETRKEAHFTDVFMDYTLSGELESARISLQVKGATLEDKRFEWELSDPSGKMVMKEKGKISELEEKSFTLDHPELWWTHDHGKPNLYTSVLKLIDNEGQVLHEVEQRTGFRRIRLVMHEGAWAKPDTFPKGRSNPPITLELNGRQIFGKGSNWVNPDIFPGTITRERYNELLELALEINFNIFRIWGGGIVNKEAFYELCDAKGILVWTEFPLACNNYKGSPEYLSVLEPESEAIIRRIRKHPSNAIWSGGNELFNAWGGMTDQSLAIRLLNSQCYLLDPKTPFIPTSPLMGMAHGNYVFRYQDNGKEVFQEMPRSVATAYTEFGMPGAASVELLRKIIPEEELFPPQPGTSWESHHAFNSWVGDTWLMKNLLEEYFGEAGTLEQLIEQSQWMQSEGYKCIYEEARRQKPVCSMALNWCYNEPWITAANNSLINYPHQPKPAFYAVSKSCRPFLASARIPKFSWKEGEMFHCELHMLNDLYAGIPSGTLSIRLRAAGEEVELLRWDFGEAPANRNLEGPTVRGILPSWDSDRFDLVLEVEGHPEYSSVYTLQYRPLEHRQLSNAARRLNQ